MLTDTGLILLDNKKVKKTFDASQFKALTIAKQSKQIVLHLAKCADLRFENDK